MCRCLFFVISGCLISLLLNGEIESGPFIRTNFNLRHLRRIAPEGIMMAMFCLLAFVLLLMVLSKARNFQRINSVMTFCLKLNRSGIAKAFIIAMLASLSQEE